jgi:hypothetical protein
LGSGDTIPTTLFAFNWLENHTLALDNFRGSYFYQRYFPPYFLVDAVNGQLTSPYPIGTAIVTLPLYAIFYLFLKATYAHAGIPLDLTAENFEVYRLWFEKLAATLITATSVVVFYWASRLKFDRRVSLTTTLIFAFATNTWMTSSQGLWQHGSANLVMLCGLFCLLQANRATAPQTRLWLALAGVACGLLPGIRPSSLWLSLAMMIYAGWVYRWQARFLLFGMVAGVSSLAWNLYQFGSLTGGYARLTRLSDFALTGAKLRQSVPGMLLSPSRGLLIYTPVILYALPGAYRACQFRRHKDEKLIGCLAIGAIAILVNYFSFTIWWAGQSFGPRYLTDLMPLACYLMNYYEALQFSQFKVNQFKLKKLIGLVISALFWVLVVTSTGVQAIGAFGAKPGVYHTLIRFNGDSRQVVPVNVDYHSVVPLNVDVFPHRLWQWQDSQIERYAHAIWHRLVPPPISDSRYLNGLHGVIKEITDVEGHPIGPTLPSPSGTALGTYKVMKATLENVGTSPWYGYQAALSQGEVQVRVRFFDHTNRPVSEQRLYVVGRPSPSATAEAIGEIYFPPEAGRYQFIADLIVENLPNRGITPEAFSQAAYSLTIEVKPLEGKR